MLPFLFLLILIQGCAPNTENPVAKPDDLIPESEYIDLLIEMQLAKIVFNTEDEFANADSLIEAIYNKYGISEEQYQTSHAWYQSDYTEQQERIEIAKDRLLQERARIEFPPDSAQSSDN